MPFFFRFLIATISFSILPPSKGYIGSKLNIVSIRFAYIRVSFERPTKQGFDTVVFELPSYKILERDGHYSDEEVEEFRKIVERGAPLFFKYAREGGLKLA